MEPRPAIFKPSMPHAADSPPTSLIPWDSCLSPLFSSSEGMSFRRRKKPFNTGSESPVTQGCSCSSGKQGSALQKLPRGWRGCPGVCLQGWQLAGDRHSKEKDSCYRQGELAGPQGPDPGEQPACPIFHKLPDRDSSGSAKGSALCVWEQHIPESL